MNNKQTEKAREAFEKEFGYFNGMEKDSEGKYMDWNLQLTWNCWETAWKTCLKINENTSCNQNNVRV